MRFEDVEARHAQEKKLVEMSRLLYDVCKDIIPDTKYVNAHVSKDGQVSVYTDENRIDITMFPDGQIYYTTDWDRMMGRNRKEKNDDTLRADH